jgi:hypothetical protein
VKRIRSIGGGCRRMALRQFTPATLSEGSSSAAQDPTVGNEVCLESGVSCWKVRITGTAGSGSAWVKRRVAGKVAHGGRITIVWFAVDMSMLQKRLLRSLEPHMIVHCASRARTAQAGQLDKKQ